MEISLSSLRRELPAILKDLPVDVAYVHGSYALGMQDAESDLDIGLLARADLSRDERRNLRLDAHVRISRTFGEQCPDLDIVILQDAPILLQYNVIRKGVLLFARSLDAQREYQLRVERMYDDAAPILEQETDVILDRILSHAA